MAVKRKLKIKKKNFAIFLICDAIIICIIVFIVHLVITGINKLTDSSNKNKPSTPVVEKKKEKKKNIEPIKTTQEEKLEKLNNINKELDFFNMDYLDRYVSYKEKNPDLSDEKIVLYVNMGLDNDYYTNTKETKYLNTTYILVNKYNSLPSDYVPKDLASISKKYSIGGMELLMVKRLHFLMKKA